MSKKTKGLQVFSAMSALVTEKRKTHPREFSQGELSSALGYKNGQFISNVERGKCGLPMHVMSKFCEILNVSEDEVKQAYLKDQEATVDAYLAESKKEVAVEATVDTTAQVSTEASTETTDTDSTTETPVSSQGFGSGLS